MSGQHLQAKSGQALMYGGAVLSVHKPLFAAGEIPRAAAVIARGTEIRKFTRFNID